MELLRNLSKTYKLTEAPSELVAAVQGQLAKIHLLDGKIDGIAGQKTLAAFAKFKSLEYLEHPVLLGKTTAMALLEATSPRQAPEDLTTPTNSPRKAYFPKLGWVAANDQVLLGGHFTWGEFTKNLARIPNNPQIVNNIIRLAEYLEKVRELFGEKEITINSAFRPESINRAVGGASNSQHLYGTAADIVISGVPPLQVYGKLNSWHGDRGGLGNGRNFTHIDLRGYRARFSYG